MPNELLNLPDFDQSVHTVHTTGDMINMFNAESSYFRPDDGYYIGDEDFPKVLDDMQTLCLDTFEGETLFFVYDPTLEEVLVVSEGGDCQVEAFEDHMDEVDIELF